MRTTTLIVEGMTCNHCVHAVTTSLRDLAGVKGVEVDLTSGQVTVSSDSELDERALRLAIEDAGYELRA